MKNLIDIIGGIAFCVLVVLLFWLFLIATPDQMSGEADMHKQMCEDNGIEYAPYFNQWKAEQANRVK